ncbi:cyclase family protein [Methylocystis sp. MJC1]|jgi:kynurenine formamidase|uniref:cyclase family protein n=1 Tax=Methylocystis sp. MJC1 TaxID=2654282 RepID=UPI001FED424E|nr:cyclase family protein [Methylocystis sp. MJC1]KAF2989447.1 Kynurenine formamidase [Methylocystis sp. MJC1]UZX10882.1 cyclase family protein [Methylocystis sp. MJC1]
MSRIKPKRIVDLSKEIVDNPNDPFFMRVKIKHHGHRKARWLVRALGLPFRLFPKDFAGWADDTITRMGVHSTTHIDAPWHYGPELSDGRRPATVDEMPLDMCFGPGVVFDMRHKADGDEITVADMEQSLRDSGATLGEGAIALIHTGRDRLQGSKDYWKRGTGMSAPATEWLIDKGVMVMGIDQWGWDLPFHHQIRASKEKNDAKSILAGPSRRPPQALLANGAIARPRATAKSWLRRGDFSAPLERRIRRAGARRRISL